MVRIIYCRKIQSILNMDNCSPAKCDFFHDRKVEEVKQGLEILKIVDRVSCGFPKWEQVLEVSNGGTE